MIFLQGENREKMDFKKYKNSLKYYLQQKGFNTSSNPMMCFNPSHNNKNTPACLVYHNNFKCENSSCGIEGDIYDACEILTGIKEKSEQYKEVEKTLKGYNVEEYDLKTKPEKEKYKPDEIALKILTEYMRNHGGRKKGVMAFLKQRGYTDDISKKMYGSLGYWPGFEIASNEIEKNVLKNAGIPFPSYKTQLSSWNNAGIIIKLNQGLKLCYYYNNKCEKRNSKGADIFPMPTQLPIKGKIILVEAELSAISMIAIGFKNTYATGGSKGLKIKTIKWIIENFQIDEILFLFDGDEPGRIASGIIKENKEKKYKCYPDIFFKNGYKGIIKIGYLPEGSGGIDPDDLIRENKIDELKKIILEAKTYNDTTKKKKEITYIQKDVKETPFIFLGHDDSAYYVIPENQNIPLRIKRGETMIKNWLKEIAPFEWWYKHFQSVDEDENISFNLAGAIAWFRKTSWMKGIYNDEKILGLGVHKDGDDIVFNTGNELYVNNKIVSYNNFKGKNIYCRSKIHLELKGTEWTIKDGTNLIRQLKTFKFERLIDYMVISGFIAIAPFSSILEKRPHMWIAGNSGLGKSTLIDLIVKPGVGKNQAIFTEGGLTSEAFFRQECGKDCRVPIIDEFDSHNKYDVLTIKNILKLARSCYGGFMAGKGSADQKSIKYNLKLMFCFASVNVTIDNKAEISRIIICRMKEKNDKEYMKEIDNFMGMRLRVFNRIKLLIEYIKSAKELIMNHGYDNRTADTYAPFIAGFWIIISDNPFFQGDEKIQNFILKAIDEIRNADNKNDDERILERIFQERIKIDPSSELTIAEMLGAGIKVDIKGEKSFAHDDLLRRYGLRRFFYNYKDNPDDTEITKIESLAIDYNHPAIKNILRDTPFQEYKEILQRHKHVLKKSVNVHMAGRTTKCIILTWKEIYEEYFKNKDNDGIPI